MDKEHATDLEMAFLDKALELTSEPGQLLSTRFVYEAMGREHKYGEAKNVIEWLYVRGLVTALKPATGSLTFSVTDKAFGNEQAGSND